MISLPGLKEYFLKAPESGDKEKDIPTTLDKKNSHPSASAGKSKFLENFKDKFALMRQPTGKSDRSGSCELPRSKRRLRRWIHRD